MPAATDQQVQQYVNERVRPWCERLRALLLEAEDHKAALDDIYEALTQQTPTWSDERTDGPPSLLTKDDVLAWNAFVTAFIASMRGDANLAVVLSACVRPVEA